MLTGTARSVPLRILIAFLVLVTTLGGALTGTARSAFAATYHAGYEETATGNSNDGNLSDCDADQWNFCRRNCTSFVAYKLNQAGVPFHNNYKNVKWGDGRNWDDAARAVGIPTGSTPKVGAVAYWNEPYANGYGHVAWVEGVNSDGSVRTSNYNGLKEIYYAESAARPHGYIYFSNVGVGGGAPVSNTTPRVGVSSSGQLHIKEGPLNATWVHVGGGTTVDMS